MPRVARGEISKALRESIRVKEAVLAQQVSLIEEMAGMIITAYKNGGKVIVFGNGGSAADAQHLAAELVGRFKLERKGLPALALSVNTSILTSIGNDYGFEYTFSRQVEALAKKGDVCIGISTSGKARNVIEAIKRAREIGARTIAFTGGDGGELARLAELSFIVPSPDTPRIQEVHITVIHLICEQVEKEIFG